MRSGLLTTGLFATAVAAMPWSGTLADRHGPKRMLGIGLALALAGNVAFAVAPSYVWLVAAKALTGLASGIGFLAGVRYIAGLYGPARSHLGQGLYGGGYPLGSAMAIWAMAPLAVATSWRGAFWISSAAIALALVLWLAAPSVAPSRTRGSIADALRCANCWWVSLEHAAGFGLGIAASTWITVYLLREFSLPLELSGILGSLLLLVAVFARPIGGYAVSREHVPTLVTMRLAQVAILAGVVALAWAGRPLAVALAGALLVGIGVGFPYAAVFNTAGASLRAAPGAAQGLAAIGGTAGALLFAPAIGYAVQTWGFAAGWSLLGALSACALLATFVMRGEEDLVRA